MDRRAPRGLGLYVHFPWCVRKCPYCDFNSHPVRGELDQRAYMDALLRDADEALAGVAEGSIGTVFCGGGTPSLFAPGHFRHLLDHLAPWLAPGAEITMEANPGTTEHADFGAYREAGINRLSIGAQSFDPRQLSRLGRIHDAHDTVRAFREARSGGFDNINLDLMYALPEQQLPGALADLDAAIELAPEHVSWYQLTIEPKTEFARRTPRLASESVQVEMEAAGLARLAAAGYGRYEVSAYAQPGRRCRHNLNYWTFGDYAGIGAGAHGKHSRPDAAAPAGLSIERTRKASQPRLYLAAPTRTERQRVDEEERVFEFMMNALRLVDGVSWETFEARTGLSRAAVADHWQPLVAQGLLEQERVAATARGFRYLDGVLERFLR